jgi:hypothetical protein
MTRTRFVWTPAFEVPAKYDFAGCPFAGVHRRRGVTFTVIPPKIINQAE